MNMGTSTMDMASMATSTAASAAAATTTAMSMDMGSSSCQISMLWNWYTVDACFIASSWHITSKSMFAGSCIGVILLVMSLEFLRRTSKEYDQYLIRQYQRSLTIAVSATPPNPSSASEKCTSTATASPMPVASTLFRPNVVQQAIRALLHMLQFAVAYFVMLLAMYFNGYIIICIIIGAFLGFFAFSWETMKIGGQATQQQEATMCCG